MSPNLVMGLDVGSSSARVWLFQAEAWTQPVATEQVDYELLTTQDGGATLDPVQLRLALEQAFDRLLKDVEPGAVEVVGCATLAGNILGLAADNSVITPLWTWADTRAAASSDYLRQTWDVAALHQRTGAPIHSAYVPARLHWLQHTQPTLLAQVARWMTLGEYLLWHWTNSPLLSYSLAAWNGIFNRQTLAFDPWLFEQLSMRAEQFSQPLPAMQGAATLQAAYAQRWPALAQARWGAPVGDGLASNIGCGATNAQRVVINLGTSGALRVIVPSGKPVPAGLWSYSINGSCELVGGAISNAGNLVEWARETLQIPPHFETQLATRTPGSHGLLVLATFAGERSPFYRDDLRGTLHGLSFHTTGLDILQALMESTACSLAAIYELLHPYLPSEHEIVCSGGALHHSVVWRQMLADALGQPIQLLNIAEATVRGAALLGYYSLDLAAIPVPQAQAIYQPNPKYHQYYRAYREQQCQLQANLKV